MVLAQVYEIQTTRPIFFMGTTAQLVSDGEQYSTYPTVIVAISRPGERKNVRHLLGVPQQHTCLQYNICNITTWQKAAPVLPVDVLCHHIYTEPEVVGEILNLKNLIPLMHFASAAG